MESRLPSKLVLRILKRLLKILAALLIGVLLVLIISVPLLHWNGDRRIHLAKKALRDGDAPMSAADLRESQVHADDNAFPLVEDLENFLHETPEVGEFWKDLNEISPDGYFEVSTLYTFEEVDEKTWTRVRELLQDEAFDTFFARIERIVRMSSLDPEWEHLEKPINGVLAVSALRNVLSILLIDGAVAAYFGDNDRAIRRIEQSAALSDLALENGTLIGALTASAMRSQTLVAYEGLSRKFPESLNLVGVTWEDDYSDAWKTILHTERLFFITPISEALLHGSEPDFKRYFNLDYQYLEDNGNILPGLSMKSLHDALQLLRSYPLRWIVKYSYAKTLSAMNEALELAPLSYHEIRQKYPEVSQTHKTRNPLLDLIPTITIEDFVKTREKLELADSHARLARIAQALWAYREDRGAFPEELKALQPAYLEELPIDPFSGRRFIYRRTGEGFALYSVGENQRDDGGVHYEINSSENPKRDLIWTGYGSVLKRELSEP